MILSDCTNGTFLIPEKFPESFTDGRSALSETKWFSDLCIANRPSSRKIFVEHMGKWCYPVAGRILPAEYIRQHPHFGHSLISVFHTARISSAIVRPV